MRLALALLFGFFGMVQSAWAVTVLAHATVEVKAGDQWQPAIQATLPYHWDNAHGAVDGIAKFRLSFAVSEASRPLALYIPRLGNTFAIRVNGNTLSTFGTMPANPYDDAAMAPHYFAIPSEWLMPATVLEIDIGATAARQAGLSQVTVGPAHEVRELYERKHLVQVTGSRIVVSVSAVLGLLALLLWARQRDPIYLMYGSGELLWALQTARTLFEHSPLPWPWWGVIPLAAFNAAPPLLCKFALTFMGLGQGRVARFANGLIMLAVPAALFTMLIGWLWLAPLFQAVITLTSLAMAWTVISAALQSSAHEKRVLGAAVAVIVACAVRDVLVLRLSSNSYDIVPWVRFAWVGFGLSLAWIVADRLRRGSAAASVAQQKLDDHLRARDAEWAEAFALQRAEEKHRGAAEERQRLMQDLHDGVGSQLVGALRIAQQPNATRDDITLQLRGAVDQLKITVDAMQETDGDIASVLGATRYRLAPRLQAAHIDLTWDVAQLPVVPHWGVRQSYQLQMILFEAFTNIVVHSRATKSSLTAHALEGSHGTTIEIILRDNGRGFDLTAARGASGRGLSNMHRRAHSLGADLQLTSTPGETRIGLRIPVI